MQEFLRNPDRYIRLGARPPRGVLLVRLAIGKKLLSYRRQVFIWFLHGFVGGSSWDRQDPSC